MSKKTEDTAIMAGHKVIIKRAMRLSGSGFTESNLRGVSQRTLNNWAKANPIHLTKVLNDYFRVAAKAWEVGNNSGDCALLSAGERKCELKRNQAESVLALFGIKCDYPGLYPIFEFNGRVHYNLDFLMANIDTFRTN